MFYCLIYVLRGLCQRKINKRKETLKKVDPCTKLCKRRKGRGGGGVKKGRRKEKSSGRQLSCSNTDLGPRWSRPPHNVFAQLIILFVNYPLRKRRLYNLNGYKLPTTGFLSCRFVAREARYVAAKWIGIVSLPSQWIGQPKATRAWLLFDDADCENNDVWLMLQ